MIEILIAGTIFSAWTAFSCTYYNKYKKIKCNNLDVNGIWTNEYIFDSIPSVFPTLGIFCTALGITLGIWNFNTDDIQGSIPELLRGLKLAFLATMTGIIGLIIFQKWNALIQKKIDENPNRQIKITDEIHAISQLDSSISKLNQDNTDQLKALGINLEKVISDKFDNLEKEIKDLKSLISINHKDYQLNSENLISEIKEGSNTTNSNTKQIISAMNENNKFIVKKFDEFSDLLAKNNTEALVDVMRNVTEQFNSQMSELISRLVQENFSELNKSVQNMNTWQQENKNQIEQLTSKFQSTTELFEVSSKTLSEVAKHSKMLVDDDSKLVALVGNLEKVMISDTKFKEIITNITSTVETLKETTESFDETTNKLNDWVRTERNFKESADVLIIKLEEFRDLNSDVWKQYRKEMSDAVSIIKTTSTSLGEDLTNINNEFYDRLNETLTNLDLCIQRFIPSNN